MASSIVVASGKGGVGKTSMAVNIGLTLAGVGHRTALLDADFGMANAHILLGVNPEHHIIDTLEGRVPLEAALCNTANGMRFISGGSGLLEMLNLDQKTRYQAIRLMDEIAIDTDYLIIDAPAGASDSSLAFVTAADHVVVVVVGEPTSFLDAYALIKAANLEGGIRNFNIVINMAQSAKEARAHYDKFSEIATRFLDVNLNLAGHMLLSNRIRQSIVKRKPISLEDPKLDENLSLKSLVKNVIGGKRNDHSGVRFFSKSAA